MLLDDWLHEKRMQNRDFAKLIGVSEMSIGNYRRGKRMPRPPVVKAIEQATEGRVTASDHHAAVIAAREAA